MSVQTAPNFDQLPPAPGPKPARNTATCTTFLCVDGNGDYGIGKDAEAARENYEADIGPLSDAYGFRIVEVEIEVELPETTKLKGTATIKDNAELTAVK